MSCYEKTEINCCPRLNKYCCPVTIVLEQGEEGQALFIVTIENKSKGPIVPGLLFSIGVFNSEPTNCTVTPECDAKFVGSRQVRKEDGTPGYEAIFRVLKEIPACDGSIEVQVFCARAALPATMVACIECFCPDLEATVRCKSMVGLCQARAKSSARGIGCCLPICSEPAPIVGPS